MPYITPQYAQNVAVANARTAPWYGAAPTSLPGASGAAFPGNVASDAALYNIQATPYGQQLVDVVNATNRMAQQQANLGRLPYAAEAEGLSGENILAGLRGEIDPSTQQMLQSRIAAQYGKRGMGVDTPALSSAYYRALGLDIAAREAAAEQQLTAAYARNPAAPIVGLESFLLSPQAYGQLQLGQTEAAINAFRAQMAAFNALRGGGGGGGGGAYTTGRRIPSAAEYNTRAAMTDTGVPVPPMYDTGYGLGELSMYPEETPITEQDLAYALDPFAAESYYGTYSSEFPNQDWSSYYDYMAPSNLGEDFSMYS